MSAIPSSCSLHEKLHSLWIQQRQGEPFVLLSESNSNDIGAFGKVSPYQNAAIADLGKERAFMGIHKLDYLPEKWTFIWKILASGKVVSV